MGGYKRKNYYRRYNKPLAGHERAIQHIREAKALSRELGGTDADVKKYFFSLTQREIRLILNEYGRQHGSSAREYAEETLPKWRSGAVQMSGLVAERLFKLLPPRMPIDSKFKLIESLWKHVAPSSSKTYYLGFNVDIEQISKTVKQHLETVVINCEIPSSMETRFNWLSQGDVEIKQKLLNYFQQQEVELLTVSLQTQLSKLKTHLNSENGVFTSHSSMELNVGKHEVKLVFDEAVDGISETQPIRKIENKSYAWVLWGVGIAAVIFFLFMS